jgi:AhpD family alkylhydroperoxidase
MRIAAKTLEHYPFFLRSLIRNQKKKYGTPLEPTLLWARIPRLYLPFLLFFSGLTRGRSLISKQLRTLVSVRVSQTNWCPFCIDLNSMLWSQAGGSSEKLEAVADWQKAAIFSAPERAALAYAEAMTITDQKVDDALFAEVCHHFTDDSVIELTAVIAFQNMSSKFNAALGALPSGLCRIPGESKSAH